MRVPFKSNFAQQLSEFVEQKLSLGFDYEHTIRYIVNFDIMCFEKFPTANELTYEIGMAWATSKPGENNNTFRNRISPVREFARFLIRRGDFAYLIPLDLVRKTPPAAPYIFSHEEIISIWKEYDTLPPISYLPIRHIVLPALIRILYCCGLRPVEACRLQVEDVNLSSGKLMIRESKGHKDRIVMMAPDVKEYMKQYHQQAEKIFPECEWFFPNTSGNICTNSWLSSVFMKVRERLELSSVCGRAPTLYSFRHTFATHRLYGWLQQEADLNVKLPYLSAYMGHVLLSDTYYYIHLVPEQFQKIAGISLSIYEKLLPEVCTDE